MSEPRNYRPVVLIRRILLVALALFLGAVVAVFIDNRMGGGGDLEGDATGGLDSSLLENILVGKGFDYEVTDGDKRLFHIRADRILADRDNVVTLEGIVLTVERSTGEIYELAAKSGRYRSEKRTAEVEGGVALTGPDGVQMRGPKFELLRKGTVVKSLGPVEFAAGQGITGSADEIEAYLEKDRFQLSGKVRLLSVSGESEANLSLEADRVVYDKPENLIHAEGGIKLQRGRDEMTCGRIAVTMSEGDDAKARFVRARWSVVGKLVSDDPRGFERRFRFAGEEASIGYGKEGNEPRVAEIVGTVQTPARFDQGDESGLVRRFSTRRIEAKFARGQVREVHTDGAMTVTEFFAFDPRRELGRVCGGSAVARFDQLGGLARLEIKGGADLHRPGLQAAGDKLTALGEDLIEVKGKPAHVYTGDGELSALALSYRSSTGDLIASDGVHAWFPPDGDFAMVKATESSDDKAIQVTADSAKWDQNQGEFQFFGDVRAWQGESFLTAGRLIGENGGHLRAEGGIQTTLERSGDVAREGEGEGEQRSPVRVTAESFDYTKDKGLIQYQGNPEVRDSGRMMSCDELAVYLGDGSRLDRLECIGNAFIDDRVGGRNVRGAEALYRPDEGKVEVSGSPVTLQNPDGAVIRASRVIYDFETSIAQFESASSTPTEGGDSGR